MQEFTTPMMRQYMGIKKQYQDCLLFFRAGDFYELFLEDAYVGAKVLNITLTHKRGGKDGKIPMAGVPYHAVDTYLSKLVKAGYKVAICEQVSLPNKYGIIDREVIRVVTPGTLMDEKALEQKENNYVVSLLVEDKKLSISSADLSTGYFSSMEGEFDVFEQALKNELSKLHPAECLLPEALYNNPNILKLLKREENLNISLFQEWDIYADNSVQFLKDHFGVKTLASFGINDKPLALQTSAALLGYLSLTQKTKVGHIKKIIYQQKNSNMTFDRSTMVNLELFSTIREHDTKGTLLKVLDKTVTAMGGRMLKLWMKNPLLDKKAILLRHEAVEVFFENSEKRFMARESLQSIVDIERILSKLSVNIGNARDLVNLSRSLKTVITVKNLIKNSSQGLIKEIYKNISSDIEEVIKIIDESILPEPRIELKEGGLIASGVSEKLDKLRKLVGGNKDWIMQLEKKEKEITGIASLKVRFNSIFGFYIEVTKPNLHLVPDSYIRRQTLINSERFITPQLKEHEEIILSSEEKINSLEYKLYTEVLQKVLSYTAGMQQAAESIAILDCLTTFAQVAEENSYVRATLQDEAILQISQGRHPVVETLMEDSQFVPNDVEFNSNSPQLLIITGPNMAGKSVFIRQIALLVLMNQIGCFIPAKSANLGIVDRIFVRSGASDVITSGLSTFMVEMVETAHILHHTTKNSLVIMDEIGRGTSTYDGISIAWAVAEFLVKNFKSQPKVLFATHYHELQKLEDEYPKSIKNYHMAVDNKLGEPVFLHTLLSGGASHSFGVAVAKLAGIPEQVIIKATEILNELEQRRIDKSGKEDHLVSEEVIADKLIHKEIEHLDIVNMTPLEALNKLAEIQEKIKIIKGTKTNFLEVE